MKYFLTLLFLLYSSFSFSQVISGNIIDKDGTILKTTVNILFKDAENKSVVKEFTIARTSVFSYELKKKYTTLLIEVIANGYHSESQIINDLSGQENKLNFVLTKNDITELKEVIIISEKKAIVEKEDTLSYNVLKFRDGTERKIEDVIKKLPGISVNDKTGEIKYNGKSVETVTLDGDNMFGYNYTLGTKNISVDMIEQVQAINNYSENPLLKGVEAGEKVSLNLKLKTGTMDVSGDLELGAGFNNESSLLNNSRANILQIAKNYKAFGLLSFNNIGENNTPFDFFSGSQSIEQLKERNFQTYKVIPETLFSNIIDNTRTNNNNLLFSNYTNLFKINKRISIKTAFYYLKDNIHFEQASNTQNTINNETFITADDNTAYKKPNLYRGDLELKFNSSENSLLEYKTKYSFEKTNTETFILANQSNVFLSNLISKSEFFNQNVIFTQKLNSSKAIQFNINQGFNSKPQGLNLANDFETNEQDSKFKKKYIDGIFTLLGSANKLKYSFSLGANYEETDFLSANQQEVNGVASIINPNKSSYLKKNVFQLGSINFTKNKWTLSPSYTLKFLNQTLDDESENSINKNNFIFEPSLLVKYKINNLSFMTSNVNYSQSPVAETAIFRNPVLTNNRVSISNIPSLELQKSINFSLFYNYNNVYKKIQTEIGFNYQNSNGGFFSFYEINQNNTEIKNFFLSKENQTYNVNISVMKFFTEIATTVKFKSNYSYYNYLNLVNSDLLRKNISSFFSNELIARTTFRSKINFENNLILVRSVFKNENSNDIKNNSCVNSLKIRYKENKKLQFVVSSEYYLPDTKNKQNNYHFIDANINYQPSKTLELIFSAKNLLNNTLFSQIQTTDFSKTVFENNLLSRYFFVNVIYTL